MVNSVSSASFGSQIGAMDKVSQEQLYNPGMYSMPELVGPPPSHRKKGGFFKFLGKLILTAAVIGGAAIGARKLIPSLSKDVLDVSKGLEENAGFGQKVKHYFAKYTDMLYDNTIAKISQWYKTRKMKHPQKDANTNTDNKS